MSDVRKALEAAAYAIGADDDNDREMARAAVLAFLRAMPDGGAPDAQWCPSCEEYKVDLWWPSRLTATIEKEAQG